MKTGGMKESVAEEKVKHAPPVPPTPKAKREKTAKLKTEEVIKKGEVQLVEERVSERARKRICFRG